MKAILINPKEEVIRFISYDGDYKSIYQILDCRAFECVYPFQNNDVIYVDEEGLLKDSNYSFNVKCSEGISYPLMGKGLILGTDAEGESIECESKLDDIKSRVTFNGKVAISEGNRGFTVVPYEEYLKALTNQKLLEILDTKGNA
jgi:hypothetical protein